MKPRDFSVSVLHPRLLLLGFSYSRLELWVVVEMFFEIAVMVRVALNDASVDGASG